MKTLASLIALAFILTACTTIKQNTRVSTTLHSLAFNNLSSQYVERPTSVSIEQMSDGKSVLCVTMVPYVDDPMSPDGPQQRFVSTQTVDYVKAINKYLEWSAKAKERGESFEKEIASVPTWANLGATGHLKFGFYSGNDQHHYLSIDFVFGGTTVAKGTLYFDEKNAIELKRLLTEFGSGQITTRDIGSNYN